MSWKSWIAKLLPVSLLNELQLRRNLKQLATVSRQECDSNALASYSQKEIDRLFESKESDAAWRAALAKIEGIGLQDISGGVNQGDRRAIFYLARELNVSSALEIGTHVGASTIHLAAAIQQNNGNDHSLDSVDIVDVNDPVQKPWQKYGVAHSPAEMVDALGCQSFVRFHAMKSLDFLESCSRSFDLIFLDGDHSAETTYLEIPAAMKRLNPGGIILLHDYFPDLQPLWSNGKVIHGPCMAGERLIRESDAVQILPLGDLPWPTKLGSNRTSLAIVCGKKLSGHS